MLINLFNSLVLIGLDKYSSNPSLIYISLIPVIALAVNAIIAADDILKDLNVNDNDKYKNMITDLNKDIVEIDNDYFKSGTDRFRLHKRQQRLPFLDWH